MHGLFWIPTHVIGCMMHNLCIANLLCIMSTNCKLIGWDIGTTMYVLHKFIVGTIVVFDYVHIEASE